MARPRNSKEKQRLQLKTVALMNSLRIRVGAQNPCQFSDWFDRETVHLGWTDTKDSNKWYKYFKGDVGQNPTRILHLLGSLFPDCAGLFHEGPERLWTALWSDSTEELWSICTYTCCAFEGDEEGSLDVMTGNTIFFGESATNFEINLISKLLHSEPYTLSDLSESIALYKIHQTINRIHKTEEISPYRCIKMCLDAENISSELKELGIYDFIYLELTKTEISRLRDESFYRMSTGASDIAQYALNPFGQRSVQDRMVELGVWL